MKLKSAKRLVLATVVTLSVSGGTLTPLVAGHAAAADALPDEQVSLNKASPILFDR
jgi:hypothetical protein